ncbi:hypothetical protein Xszus_04073 [Xenorhabdus szentirmaii]|uniref:Uncharacterized protein n=1 Tax=Xenorhabdus szentirmaii DSM 16338 TaxID=1427518 RepID=W1J4C9_9GAMM|nr:hypothetical protein Xsze_01898 [Xenorhabdus szentirmaii DSM 16338]PHM44243.1 hypothetical protein Xszus_04073 [Xenorhabdus szentirmaii]CDL84716.1 conserved hypothetical protein [Xenorhabdus szentirmaii DSM 16338]
MSGWTGELYRFYTNKPIEKIFEVLKREINHIDYQYEYYSYDGEESLFFIKIKIC